MVLVQQESIKMENIKFSVEAQRSFMHLPLEIPRNSDLSLSAKGMYSIL